MALTGYGQSDGIATLDSNGNVPASQLGNIPPVNPATESTAGTVETPQTETTPIVPVFVARPSETPLTTTNATTILTYTPSIAGLFRVSGYVRVTGATTTVTLTLTYTSNSGAQTYTIWNAQNLAVGDHGFLPFTFQDVSGDAITLSATAGTASQVYIDARLEAL